MVQFRKSKKIGPVRVTVSKKGISGSVGAGPVRVSKGADGKVRRTLRIPGTGVYDTKVVGQPQRGADTGRPTELPPPVNTNPPAGWYPDPSGAPRQRYFDGYDWTQHFHPPLEEQG